MCFIFNSVAPSRRRECERQPEAINTIVSHDSSTKLFENKPNDPIEKSMMKVIY